MAHYRDGDTRIEGFDLTRGQVLEINCSECGARPGERCITAGGNVKHEPHFMRKMDRHEGKDPGPRKWTPDQIKAWLISLTIRNELEMFHGGGAMDPEDPNAEEGFITDRQMKALNIVIRHTVYEVLSALSDPSRVVNEEHGITNAQRLGLTMRYINDYMEPPGSDELERAYKDIKEGHFDPPRFVPDGSRSKP